METATTPLPRSRRRRVIAAAALVAALAPLTAAGPARADAATYTVWSCRGPDGASLPASAWQPAGADDTCASGGALTAAITGADTAGAVFLAPPGTRIAAYRANLTAHTGDAWWHGSGVQAGLAEGGLLETPQVSAGCSGGDCVFGDEQDPLGPAGAVERTPRDGTGALSLVASCAPHWLLGCGFGAHGTAEAVARLWRSAVDLGDASAPVIGAPGGSLLAGPALGRATLSAPVSDLGGGVAEVTLLVDGAVAGTVRPGGACAEPYTVPAPCPADLPTTFDLDTAGLAPGPHTAVLRATDAAGGAAERGPIAFTVGAPAPATAVAGVVATAPREATVRVTRRRVAPGGTVRGVVLLAGGGPVAGARLVAAARRFGPGDPPEAAAGSATTGADGSFALPAGRTPRTLVLRLDDPGYRAAPSAPVQVAGPLLIRARPSASRLRNGALLTLRARIVGAGPGAAAGRTVLVQARVGGRWTTVDSVEARGDGTAAWRYRFRRTTRPAVYRFRLRIPAGGADWPWPARRSPAVTVAVSP